MNYNIHYAMVARVQRKQRLAVERAVDEFGRRQAWVDNGGNPDKFVSAPELPACITDPFYDPR